MTKQISKSFIILITFFLICFTFANQQQQDTFKLDHEIIDKVKPKIDKIRDYIISSPISISSDSEFESFDPSNDGTIDYPYQIRGFNITHEEGVYLISVQDISVYFEIEDNYLNGQDTTDAVKVSNASYVIIKNNTIEDSGGFGISLINVNHSTIENNTVKHCSGKGIGVQAQSTNNTITHNKIEDYRIAGIYCHEIYNTTISDNNVTKGTSFGLELLGCSNINVSNNIVTNSKYYGIVVVSTNKTTIENNVIFNNSQHGISFSNTSVYSNNYNNIVRNNDFIKNCRQWLSSLLDNQQAMDYQYFSSAQFEGNYWDEWTYPDTDDNGYVDNPYKFYGNQDSNPRRSPVQPGKIHYLTRFHIVSPVGGEVISGNYTLVWTAAIDSFDFDVSYSIYQKWETQTSWKKVGSTDKIDFVWDTTTVNDAGIHLIKIVANNSEGYHSEVLISSPFTIKNNPDSSTNTTPNITSSWNSVFLLLLPLVLISSKRLWRK